MTQTRRPSNGVSVLPQPPELIANFAQKYHVNPNEPKVLPHGDCQTPALVDKVSPYAALLAGRLWYLTGDPIVEWSPTGVAEAVTGADAIGDINPDIKQKQRGYLCA
jgi:hypothetical protein